MVKGARWVLKQHFDGIPKATDFDLVEDELAELKDGEILVKALYLSVDPYMRPYTRRFNPPLTMIGQSVSEVLESKDPDFTKGM
jgi:prostaglandin reductase 1